MVRGLTKEITLQDWRGINNPTIPENHPGDKSWTIAPTRVYHHNHILGETRSGAPELKRRGSAAYSLVGAPLHSPTSEAAYRQSFATMAQEGADAVFVGDEPEHFHYRLLIAELAETSRPPTVYSWREGVEADGFMAYAFEILDLFRHDADIIAKILAGAKPSDIPFYQARKFELSFNLPCPGVHLDQLRRAPAPVHALKLLAWIFAQPRPQPR